LSYKFLVTKSDAFILSVEAACDLILKMRRKPTFYGDVIIQARAYNEDHQQDQIDGFNYAIEELVQKFHGQDVPLRNQSVVVARKTKTTCLKIRAERGI
jgi:hypothetical protein